MSLGECVAHMDGPAETSIVATGAADDGWTTDSATDGWADGQTGEDKKGGQRRRGQRERKEGKATLRTKVDNHHQQTSYCKHMLLHEELRSFARAAAGACTTRASQFRPHILAPTTRSGTKSTRTPVSKWTPGGPHNRSQIRTQFARKLTKIGRKSTEN